MRSIGPSENRTVATGDFVPARQVIERLMRLDGIVMFPELMYLATEDEKVAFLGEMASSLRRNHS